ncbi:SWI/SNF complex subunit SWI3B [Abeliophyllum distichum]|uniref:SWI/SNF complex subunit SWI3B n=1 Tax=Abeliophyllum distichum TaxID=126358 RepID=A0ABD1Q9S4_9LAMI
MATGNKSPSTPIPESSAAKPISDASTPTITIDLTPPSDSTPGAITTTSAAAASASNSITAPNSIATTTTTTATATSTSNSTARPHSEQLSSDADIIHIPSYSRWFAWNSVHECEVRFVPEFFDGRSPSKNPRVYKYYRNAIIRRFRENPAKKITFTEVRKTIVGDVGSIRRIFDFLEAWGLINYTGSSKPQLKWEEKESKLAAAALQGGDAAGGSGTNVTISKSKLCSNCKGVCSFACFASDKHDMTLCARCYVRGSYRDSSEFKRVEISEEAKTDWTDKETLQLLEAIMHYGDDWKKVAEHVGGRSEKECVTHFVNLPFGEQFDGPPESAELDTALSSQNLSRPTKRMCPSPLTDLSHPIMAQAAFLSTLVGVDVAEVAARAALTALSALGDGKLKESFKISSGAAKQQESDIASNSDDPNSMEGDLAEARLQLEKEDEELEKAISGIAVQTKEIEDKIVQFEEFDLQMERKRQQLQQLLNLLFVDQFTLSLHKTPAQQKAGESVGEGVKAD